MENIAQFVESLGSLLYPIVLFSFLLIAKKPIAELIKNISEVVLKAQTIKLSGGLTLSRDAVESALVDRERLVIGILVGASEYPDKNELRDLAVQAEVLDTHLETLSSSDKQKLMNYAIALAAADEKFSKKELNTLIQIGMRYGQRPRNVMARIKNLSKDLHIDTSEIYKELEEE